MVPARDHQHIITIPHLQQFWEEDIRYVPSVKNKTTCSKDFVAFHAHEQNIYNADASDATVDSDIQRHAVYDHR